MSMTTEPRRPNGSTPPMPKAENIPEKPETVHVPASIGAIQGRADSNIHLVMGVVTENLDGLRSQIDEMQKMLDQDAQRLLRIQSDFIHSAGVLLNMKDGAMNTLSALRAGRARLVAVAEGEENR